MIGLDVVYRRQAGVLYLLAACVLGGCNQVEVLRPAKLDPEAVGQQALLEYDTNGDTRIDEDELAKSPGLSDGLSATDQDEDKTLTADEIATRVRFHADRKVALLPVRYSLTLDGRPLSGATMTMVPEAFFQGGIPVATGESDDEGIVEPTMQFDEKLQDQDSLHGVRPGVYRIEISKKDADGAEIIPAKYNAQSQLGRDVGVGPHQHGPIISDTRDLKLSSR
jgi:hypothetical protein